MRSVNAHKVTFLGFLIFSLITVSASALGQTTTRPKTTSSATTSYRYAYQYGYRAGYDDGLTKGKSDFNENEPRDFSASEAYKNADRGYSERYGTLAEYQEGYRIGFELGYNDGYLGRTSSSTTLPTNLGKVVIATVNASSSGDVAPEPSRPPLTGASSTTQGTRQPSGSQGGTIIVRDGVQMKIRLTTEINTKTNRQGDRFTAIVLDPSEYADAVVEGFIAKLNKSGSASGKTELSLAFSSIRMRDGRTGKLAAQVERVYESEKVKSIDEEGNV